MNHHKQKLEPVILAASTAALSPLVYGTCISSVIILSKHISTVFNQNSVSIYRNFNLLLFGGAFISNIVASNVNLERLKSIRISSALFMMGYGALWIPHISALYSGRFLMGLAAGIQANAVPCYISEISPSKYRGTLTSFYAISLISGIILGYALAIVGACIYTTGAIIFLLCIYQNAALGGFVHSLPVLPSTLPLNEPSLGFFEFLSSQKARKSLLIIAMFHLAQHLSGINHIILNASTIFPDSDALLIALQLCILALAASTISSYLTDRFGRAPLTFTSCSFMISSCSAFYFAFYTKFFAVLFIVGYNIAISNIPFVLIGEVFPPEQIRHGALFATSCNWWSAFISVFFMVLLMMVVVLFYTETKGRLPSYQ